MTLKVGMVRGPFANPAEAQLFEELTSFNVQPFCIISCDHVYDISAVNLPKRTTHSVGHLGLNFFSSLLSEYICTTIFKFNPLAYRSYMLGFDRLIVDLDILHTVDLFYPFSYQCIKSGKPTIVTVWENIPFMNEVKPYSKFKEQVKKKASHFLAVTRKAKEVLEMEGIETSRVSLFTPGIDINRFRPLEKHSLRIKYRIPEDRIIILFVGRFVPEKGVFDLLLAMKKLQKEIANVLLILVGAGCKTKLKELINKLGINSVVKILGQIKYSDMPNIYNVADIFCLPSIPMKFWQEQFGYALVEAMSCGKPVISTISGSIPEIVNDGESGILVPPADFIALTKALRELILDEENRKALGARARELALKRFDAKKSAKELAHIYESIG